MLKILLRLCKGIALIMLTVSLHLAVAYLLPFPYNTTNMILAICVMYVFWTQSGYVVWLAFFSFLFIELYTSQPFGFHLVAGTLGTMAMYWLLQEVFTHRSWYTVIASTMAVVIGYRVLYIFLFIAFHVSINTLVLPPVRVMVSLYALELLFTGVVTLTTFFLSKSCIKKWGRDKQLYSL